MTLIVGGCQGAIYLINVIINGPGSYPDANDFYSFTHWGLGVGILIFAVICVLIVLISFIYLKAHSEIQKKREVAGRNVK